MRIASLSVGFFALCHKIYLDALELHKLKARLSHVLEMPGILDVVKPG